MITILTLIHKVAEGLEICGLYYKNILMIVSDDCKWSLYYTGVIYDRHLMCFTLAL